MFQPVSSVACVARSCLFCFGSLRFELLAQFLQIFLQKDYVFEIAINECIRQDLLSWISIVGLLYGSGSCSSFFMSRVWPCMDDFNSPRLTFSHFSVS